MDIYSVFTMLGGLGLFIYGMQMLGDGLEKTAGDRLRIIIEKLTTNKFMGFIVGCLVTFVIQSSSATTVMVVGFVNAGLMNLSQAVGVVLGANVGTTITAQLIAFKLTKIAPVFALIGFLLMLDKDKKGQRYNIGYVLFGFAVLFIGMNLMGDAMKPLQHSAVFQRMMISFQNPFLGILIGLLITTIIQSSSVSIGLLQAIALSGLISMRSSVYLIMGMNIGTCITALLASIGSNENAKRVAVIHVLQKMMATIIFLALMLFIPFVSIVERWSPGDVVRQIANMHTLFNVIGVIFLMPISAFTIKLSKMIIPDKPPTPEEAEHRLKYIDKNMLSTPVIAQSQLMKEVDRLGRIVYDNFHDSRHCILENDTSLDRKVLNTEVNIDYLTDKITNFMILLQSKGGLSQEEEVKMGQIYHVIIDMERIGDYAENVIEYAEKMRHRGISFSQEALNELRDIFDGVEKTYAYALDAFMSKNDQLVDETCKAEEKVDQMVETYLNNHIERMANQMCDPTKGVVFTNLLNDLERVSDHAQNIAYLVRPKDTLMTNMKVKATS